VVRASLAAVRAAREATLARDRRARTRARAFWLTTTVVAGAGILALSSPGPRVSPRAVAAPQPMTVTVPLPPAPLVVTPAEPVPQPVVAPAPEPRIETCADVFAAGRWRAAATACAAAFEQDNDPRLALRAAHAYHRRGRFDRAGEWARRALALDDQLAEAYIIVAHAESSAGNAAAAAEAYRRYLALVPRGWHADEARAALDSDQAAIK
jgi:tetratricopeptide (TPR) repeat protein